MRSNEKYSEKNLAQQRGDKDVQTKQSQVRELQDLRRACQRAARSATLFQSYQADMFEVDADNLGSDEVRKRQTNSAYEATEVLFAAIVRRCLLQTFTSTQRLDSISHVMNKDAPTDHKFENTQQYGRCIKHEIHQSLAKLYQGIQHYIDLDASHGDPHELLYLFLSGHHPKPSCSYHEVDQAGETRYHCDQIADWHEPPLCRSHRCVLGVGPACVRCPSEIHPFSKGMLCKGHMCLSDGCDQPRFGIEKEINGTVLENYCISHSCFVCVRINISPASEALDDAPRNVCEDHQLCSVMDCFQLAIKGTDYCGVHTWEKCEHRDKWGQQCTRWAIASDMPCCDYHIGGWLKRKHSEIVASDEAIEINLNHAAALKMNSEKRIKCKGLNKKRKPCGDFAMIGSQFCEAHSPKDASFKAKQVERDADFRRLQVEELSAKTQGAELKEETQQKDAISRSDPIQGMDNSSHSSANDDESSYGPPPDVNNVDFDYCDNLDEAEEAEGVQHMREIFEIEGGDEEDDEDGFHDALCVLPEVYREELSTAAADDIRINISKKTNGPHVKDPTDWSWSLSLDDRWAACQAFMHDQCSELSHVMGMVKKDLPQARKSLRDAESRSRARVFENKTVIGGTIVGCITRLESIRATRPFTVIVEEASEVLEPLLFACLCQSTVKLQLIGDHLQLQPSLMDKFDFIRINKVNVSMFERLITAPDEHRVPSGVLSVQRRMRRDICDITREYYTDIVAIEDHPDCATKTLPGQEAQLSFWTGREIPGVRSHLYLWTHTGAQGRADVGVSKQNKQEAQMCVNLSYYLVKCGLRKPSIAILTPYKGQLMLIRKILLSDQSSSRLLTTDPSNSNQVRLSTVDRFQGDEADVVIASLVVDEKSRTQFVKLQNRMIVSTVHCSSLSLISGVCTI